MTLTFNSFGQTRILGATTGFTIGTLTNVFLESTELEREHQYILQFLTVTTIGVGIDAVVYNKTGFTNLNTCMSMAVGSLASIAAMQMKNYFTERKQNKQLKL